MQCGHLPTERVSDNTFCPSSSPNTLGFSFPQIGSCKNVTVMSLRSNKLEFLPDEIGQMQKLRVLNLSDNRYSPRHFANHLEGFSF